MKKVCLLLIALSLPISAQAQVFSASVNAGVALSASNASVAVTLAAYSGGRVGLGLGVTALLGLRLWDLSLAPRILLRLGVLDLGLGVSFLVIEPTVPYLSWWNRIAPIGIVGLALPLADVGRGVLEADLSLEFFPTAKFDAGLPNGAGFVFLIESFKARFALGYRWPL